MNKFIKEQLDKTKLNIPPYNDDTTMIIIPKSSSSSINNVDLLVGHWYSIYVENYILNPSDNFTLADNWNNGTKPDDNRLIAQIVNINGKMIYVNTKGMSTQTVWSGWLPRKSFTIVEELYSGR